MVRYWRLLKVFSCEIGDAHELSRTGVQVAEDFPIIGNLAVTTHILINYSKANFFLKWSCKSKQCLYLHLKITFRLQDCKFLHIVCLSPDLKSSESLAKHGKTKANSLLQKLFNNLIQDVLEIIIVFEYCF